MDYNMLPVIVFGFHQKVEILQSRQPSSRHSERSEESPSNSSQVVLE
jgi:hypothetical protein